MVLNLKMDAKSLYPQLMHYIQIILEPYVVVMQGTNQNAHFDLLIVFTFP